MRLSYEAGRCQREIGGACGLSRSAMRSVLKQTREAGMEWPLPGGFDDEALSSRLYGKRRRGGRE